MMSVLIVMGLVSLGTFGGMYVGNKTAEPTWDKPDINLWLVMCGAYGVIISILCLLIIATWMFK